MANNKHTHFSFDRFEETDQNIDENINKKQLFEQNINNVLKGITISYLSQGLLSLITAPLSTVYISLQMTNNFSMNLNNQVFFQRALQKIKDQTKKRDYKRYCDLNLFGQNRPYNNKFYEGYADCFKKLSREGMKGLFKGNLTGFTYQFFQNMLKIELHKFLFNREVQNYDGVSYLQLFVKSFFVNSIIDILMQPIHTYQARLIYQDSRNHFRIYNSKFQYLKKQLKNYTLFRAWKANIPINLIYALNVHPYMQQSPEKLLQGLALISFLTYPFTTIQRRLEIQR